MKHTLFNIASWFTVQPQRFFIALLVFVLVLALVTGGAMACGPASGGSSNCPGG